MTASGFINAPEVPDGWTLRAVSPGRWKAIWGALPFEIDGEEEIPDDESAIVFEGNRRDIETVVPLLDREARRLTSLTPSDSNQEVGE